MLLGCIIIKHDVVVGGGVADQTGVKYDIMVWLAEKRES